MVYDLIFDFWNPPQSIMEEDSKLNPGLLRRKVSKTPPWSYFRMFFVMNP